MIQPNFGVAQSKKQLFCPCSPFPGQNNKEENDQEASWMLGARMALTALGRRLLLADMDATSRDLPLQSMS
eukprot:11228915-Karenia_brevis.AAC.1